VLDWNQSAGEIARRIRALAHRAPVRTDLQGTGVQLLAAEPRELAPAAAPGVILPSPKRGILVACGAGALAVESLKAARGKGRTLSAADAKNGFAGLFRPGARFR